MPHTLNHPTSKLSELYLSVFDQIFSFICRIQPLKLPYGLPAEEDMAETYLNSKGELIVRKLLKPVEPKAIDS